MQDGGRGRDAVFGELYEKLRAELMERLNGVDANVLIQVVSQGAGAIPAVPPQFFSDWPDTYNRETWYKTWAKAEFAELPPGFDPTTETGGMPAAKPDSGGETA